MSASLQETSQVNGRRFGRLTALGFVNVEAGIGMQPNFRNWLFKCDCGNTVTAPLFKAKRGFLRSCGCADKEAFERMFKVPGSPHLRIARTVYNPDIIVSEYRTSVVARGTSVIGDWLCEGMFDREQILAIEEAKMLWTLIARPSNQFFDSDDPEDRREGLEAERAKNLLRNCRRLVGSQDWAVFENVVRWNEPLGFIGSKHLDDLKSDCGHAKATVLYVVDQIVEARILDETGLSRLLDE